MEQLLEHFKTLNVGSSWKNKLDDDLCTLSRHYAMNMYENIAFIPYEHFDDTCKNQLIDYLSRHNHARELLSQKIAEMYPDMIIHEYDVDSIMDYYICSLQLVNDNATIC